MKVISIPKVFSKADGTPFRQIKREKGDAVFKKDKDSQPLRDAQGNILWELEDADFLTVVRSFLNGLPMMAREKKKELKMEDSSAAVQIFRAINVVIDGKLELEDFSHRWLLSKVEEYGVDALGLDAAILVEVMQKAEELDSSRSERRREEKKR